MQNSEKSWECTALPLGSSLKSKKREGVREERQTETTKEKKERKEKMFFSHPRQL